MKRRQQQTAKWSREYFFVGLSTLFHPHCIFQYFSNCPKIASGFVSENWYFNENFFCFLDRTGKRCWVMISWKNIMKFSCYKLFPNYNWLSNCKFDWAWIQKIVQKAHLFRSRNSQNPTKNGKTCCEKNSSKHWCHYDPI